MIYNSFLNVQVFALLTVIFCTPCKGQTKPELKDVTKFNDITRLINSGSGESKAIGIRRAKVIKSPPALNGPADNVHCGLQDKKGNLWFGTTGHGVFRYDGRSFTKFTVIDGLNSNDVWSMIEDSEANILFGTGRGVALYDGKSFADITKHQIFGQQAIWSLLQDKKGRIWISTDYNGTYFYDGKSFGSLTSIAAVVNESNLTLNGLNGMAEDKAGNLWFASWPPGGEGLSRYDGQRITKFTEKDGVIGPLFHCVIEDKSGIVWIGSRDYGVFRYDRNSFTHISDKNGPGNDCIYSILEDRNGNIWFATERKGVYRYDGKFFKNYTIQDGLINNSVFSVVEDKAGNLWFGTRNVGLCRFDGKSFVNFSE